MSILERFKQRRLVQWGLAYLASAWLILQVLALVAESFNWPAMIMQAMILLLAIGFFAALIVAWYHGERGYQRVTGPELVMLATLFLFAGAAVTLVRARTASEPVEAPRPNIVAEQGAIAVLPFVNISDDRANEHFADGITEEILNALAHVEGLRVVARTSSFAFKDRTTDVRQIGQTLGVKHILEGSVRKSGSQLKIAAQLIDARNGYHLWSQTYDRELTDIFDVQEEISRSVVKALEIELVGSDRQRRVMPETESERAHELYLLGLFHWNKRRSADLRLAADYFRKAIAEDPIYASAYSGLALTLAVLPGYDRSVIADRAFAEGKAAARRAIELDPHLAEPYAALGSMANWDWASAERYYTKAVDLNPNYATAHQWRGQMLLYLRRLDESQIALERALRLDPLSLVINEVYGLVLEYQRDYEGAIAQFRRTLRLDSEYPLGNLSLARALLLTKRYDEAIPHLEKFGADWPDGSARAIVRGLADPAERSGALRALSDSVVSTSLGPRRLAAFYVRLGEAERALELLTEGVAKEEPWMPYMAVEPEFDPIRSDPRFQRLLGRMGLGR